MLQKKVPVQRTRLKKYLLLFWHAPLGVRSAIRRHEPPQRAVLARLTALFSVRL